MINNFIAGLPRYVQERIHITNNKDEEIIPDRKNYERVIIPTTIDPEDFYEENKESIRDNDIREDEGLEYATRVIYAALQIDPTPLQSISDILLTAHKR